ncbi:hypothetical protein AB0L06_20035 [Spirillospora sp. NPDC052269]
MRYANYISLRRQSPPLEISPDGWRIAYNRAKDQRLVVRDLTTGESRDVGRAFTIEGSQSTAILGAYLP